MREEPEEGHGHKVASIPDWRERDDCSGASYP